MKIRLKSYFDRIEEVDVIHYVSNVKDWEHRGSIEQLDHDLHKTQERLGRLVSLLVQKDKLNASDVHYIVEGYLNDDVELIGD